MSTSAMKQALEAMEIAHDESLDGNEFECRQILVAQITYLRTAIEQAEDAIAAEREACAKLVEELDRDSDQYRNDNW